MTSKTDLHRIIDALPDDLVDEAADRLADIHSPEDLARALKQRGTFDQWCELVAWLQEDLEPLERCLLTAPFDDERVTDEERAAIAEAYEDIRNGRLVGGAEVRRELGV